MTTCVNVWNFATVMLLSGALGCVIGMLLTSMFSVGDTR